jgi:hypothetical protein
MNAQAGQTEEGAFVKDLTRAPVFPSFAARLLRNTGVAGLNRDCNAAARGEVSQETTGCTMNMKPTGKSRVTDGTSI